MYAISLMKKGNYKKAIFYLEKAKLWPEHLGAGKPFDADERIENYLEAISYKKLGDIKKSEELLKSVIKYTVSRTTDKLTKSYPEYDIIGYLAAIKLKDFKAKEKIENIINTRDKDVREVFKNSDSKNYLSKVFKKSAPDSSMNFLLKILLNI